MLEQWNPTKKEIEDWLDQKLHEFVLQEKKPRRYPTKGGWIATYIWKSTRFSSRLSR